jgi:hypothetical protein
MHKLLRSGGGLGRGPNEQWKRPLAPSLPRCAGEEILHGHLR